MVRFNVSGLVYHEMAKICRSMPRHYECIRELNYQMFLMEYDCGVQQLLKDRLLLRVQIC